MRKIATGLLLTFLLGIGLVQSPATADSWKWRDRGAGSGPLAIADVRGGHGRWGPTLTITFDRPLNPAAMSREDFVVVDVQADGRGKSERWIYFVGVDGRLRSFVYYPKERYLSTTPWEFTRPNARSIRLYPVTYSEDTEVGGHMFAVGAYSETGAACNPRCWDVVPNRRYLIHDYTDPELVLFSPEPGFWLEPEIPVRWRATDRGLSGIRRAALMQSEAGSGKWKAATVGREAGMQRASVPAVEGSHTLLQLVADDGALNVTRSRVVAVRVPYDQANEAGSGTFTGLWLEEDDPAAFGGSIHSSAAPLDTLSFSGNANAYCVVVQWKDEITTSARLTAGDAVLDISHQAGTGAYSAPYCVETETVEERTATLTVQTGRLSVDGYWTGVDRKWQGVRPPRERSAPLPVVQVPVPSAEALQEAAPRG